MPLSDGIPSSPGPEASPEETIKWYKAQYEILETELADFQASSKELEAELERDVEASEKRERQLKDKASSLEYEVEEWKTKYKQAKNEASSAQNKLQKEITELRDMNRTLQMKIRDIEVTNDDYERQQRNTESSLEDMESKYNHTLERNVMLEEEVKNGEQEREGLRIEAQRLRDELSDTKIETDIVREKLRKAEQALEHGRKHLTLDSIPRTSSPHSELSPTATTTSSPSFDTPPPKTASSSGLSDTPTPPSPPASEKSGAAGKSFAVPSIPKSRLSINSNTTPRPSNYIARPPGHGRGPSVTVNGRGAPSSSFRQSLSKPGQIPPKQSGLPQSSSIAQLRTLRSRMQNLEARVQNARSKLPAPVGTPPKASPRSGSALSSHIPSSVTVRSSRRRGGGSIISGGGSLPDQDPATPSQLKPKASRTSLGLAQTQTPSHEMPPPRPSSRASVSSRSSYAPHIPGHSRPGSRASISNLRSPFSSSGMGSLAANALSDRSRPKSSLSIHSLDGTMDEENEGNIGGKDFATPTPRRNTFVKQRTSDVGLASAIPSPSKRLSYGTSGSKLPGPVSGRRQSSGLTKPLGEGSTGATDTMRPPSRPALNDVQEGEGYDVHETF